MKISIEFADGSTDTTDDKGATINGIMMNMNNDSNFIRLGDGVYKKSNIYSIVKIDETN